MSMSTRKLGIVFALFVIFGLVGCVFTASARGKPETVPGKFIVVFKDDVVNSPEVANEMAKTHGLSLENVYSSALKGYSASIPQAKLEKIKADPRVQFVSEDKLVEAWAQTSPTGVRRVNTPTNPNKGTGVGVAVIDTGIDLSHPDLAGNIVASKSCILGKFNANDDNGHGTHVAGTIAALNNTVGVVGVASEAKLIAVKVLNSSGSGTWSSIICGIDWVTANAAKYNIKVANMSLGGSGVSDNNCGNTNNDALHKAICRSTSAGVTYVVAAGNSAMDAKNSVPSSYDDSVITVSALADSDGTAGGVGSKTVYGADDTFASFSNYGSVVDIAAPGVSIYSTWKGKNYNTISGTSMATPHVAAAAALYIKSHPGSTWLEVRNGLVAAAESLNNGHTDPSGLHPEPVLKASGL